MRGTSTTFFVARPPHPVAAREAAVDVARESIVIAMVIAVVMSITIAVNTAGAEHTASSSHTQFLHYVFLQLPVLIFS